MISSSPLGKEPAPPSQHVSALDPAVNGVVWQRRVGLTLYKTFLLWSTHR